MSDLDYRSWGETQNCHGCRYWSELIAQSRGAGIEALCLNPQSANSGKYMSDRKSCDQWEEGSLGAVDSPEGNPYQGAAI